MRRLFIAACCLLLACAGALPAFDVPGTIKKIDIEKGTIVVFANGQDRNLLIDKEVQVFGVDGKLLADGIKAREVKEGAEGLLTVERGDGAPLLKAIHLGQTAAKKEVKAAPLTGKATVGIKPLTDMKGTDKYKGEDGGLYGGGSNEPPAELLATAKAVTAKIVPLDEKGQPAQDGKIGLVSLSMSNATMEYSAFKQLADALEKKTPQVSIVDCAQGGQAMAQWVDPKGHAWTEADKRLAAAKVSPEQVQVVWVKLANVRPTGELAEHGKKLQKDTTLLLENARKRFPNLRIAYLSGRIYGGWATTELNPEPYAFESSLVVRWLIQDQLKGVADLNYDAAKGPVKVPLLLWGPYLWADGTTPRKTDGLMWERADLTDNDGTHPTQSGRKKVAELLLKFFTEDAFAKTWFVKK